VDLKKLASVECFETSDDEVACNISSITDYIRKIHKQPVELWLACTEMDAMENSLIGFVSVEERTPVNVLSRYVEAASAEPLDYWLCPDCDVEFPDCDVEFPDTDEASFVSTAAEDASCVQLEPEFDVARVTSPIHRVQCEPYSLWVVSCEDVNEIAGRNSSFAVPNTAIIANNTPPQHNDYMCNLWSPLQPISTRHKW